MKTGIELIAFERQEQIEKHNRTIEKDVVENNEAQLKHAARKLISSALERENGCPKGWNQNIYNKMADKSMIDRLVIAGALIAAEIDRLNAESQTKS